MNISTKGRYAIRALVELAKRNNTEPVSVKDISESQDVSMTYLEHLLIKLKKAGIVGSQRGAYGGYYLNKAPKDITLCDVIVAVEGPVYLSKCLKSKHEFDCKFIKDCQLQGFWDKLSKSIEDLFKEVTLEQILGELK